MHRGFITVFLAMAFCFGTANKANAQILYGYSTPTYDNNNNNGYTQSTYGSDLSNWYNPWGGYMSSGGGGGYSSPVTVYPPIYPPLPSYQRSLARMYGYLPSVANGMGGMYGGMYGGMPPFANGGMNYGGFNGMRPWYGGVSPWMTGGVRPWSMSPMWMRR
jgi:hypothetical protein